jgi:hypothetical protein
MAAPSARVADGFSCGVASLARLGMSSDIRSLSRHPRNTIGINATEPWRRRKFETAIAVAADRGRKKINLKKTGA